MTICSKLKIIALGGSSAITYLLNAFACRIVNMYMNAKVKSVDALIDFCLHKEYFEY